MSTNTRLIDVVCMVVLTIVGAIGAGWFLGYFLPTVIANIF
jgi:hypothetical protein